MAAPFIRLGLGVADKLIDQHFDKFNNDLFTPGRRKKGLKRLATLKKEAKDAEAKMTGHAPPAKAASAPSSDEYTDSGSESDDDDYYNRGRRQSNRAARESGRRGRSEPRRRMRSVDMYYHPGYDYTNDPRYHIPPATAYGTAALEPHPPGYVQDPYAQQPRRVRMLEQDPRRQAGGYQVREEIYTHEPQRGYGAPQHRPSEKPRQTRPRLMQRSSSMDDVRVRRGRDGDNGRKKAGDRSGDKEARGEAANGKGKKWDKEGKLSLLAAGVGAAGAVLLSR